MQKKRKSLKTSTYDELEKVLFEWLMQACSCNVLINRTIMKEKALEMSSCLELNDFTASNGWTGSREDTI